MNKTEKLDYWKDWLGRNEAAYEEELGKMDRREALYRGEVRDIEPLTRRDRERSGERRKTVHLRNIVAENIESEVNSTIPQPKVTARRQADEGKAKLLEDMLRNELDRLPMEELNDLAERTIPIQGGAFWLVEWDNSKRTHSTVGDVVVSLLHPKQVIPQDGVYGRLEDMDAVVLKLPQTRESIRRQYGKDVDEGEAEPEVRALSGEAATADDMVTQYVAYYRNKSGGVGKFSWVCDTVLEDMEDYEARRLRRCVECRSPVTDREARVCPVCGGKLAEGVEAEEELFSGVTTQAGTQIPGAAAGVDEAGLPVLTPTRLPYYKPDVFPVFLQRNVSLFGRLLGDSDADKIEDQQNTVSRMETKIIDRLIKAGTRITLPDRADFRVDPEDGDKWYIGNAADKAMIDVYQFSGDLSFEMQYLAGVYEEARQILGITDSFQGRQDRTAESGVAKQFAAAQSAGRLESKRVLKEAAYAELFKRIAQLKVAYADEPRPIVASDDRGEAQYEEFNRYDFYEQDAAGAWHCILDDDRFLFSCDTSTPLANNREQMWQEAGAMFQMGAFGQPGSMDALILYWTKLELLHYPGASDTKEYLEMLKKEQEQQETQPGEYREELLRQVDTQAKEDAWREAIRAKMKRG
ncbi:MAG: hypothetical protein IKO91_05230 [Oscillospiraceae bacterium]|nr:hypothetical protein [Oscillospiraceae bacterium]